MDDSPNTPAPPVPSPPPKQSIKDQLAALQREAYSEAVITVIQANSQMTLRELSEKIGDDATAVDILMSTPLHDLVGVSEPERRAPAKNGKTKAKDKKAPPVPKAKKDAKNLAEFLQGRKKGDIFKTVEYRDAAGIGHETALTQLHRSGALEKRGERRGMVWVVQ